MSHSVKWYSSAMQGAPLLSSGSGGAAHTVPQGSLIALLKAILVTGFGVQALGSAVYDSQAATITLTLSSGHAYLKDSIIEVSGANEAGFNGEFRVQSTTTNTVVVGLENGTPGAAAATGDLAIKIPGLGWEVLFEDAANYKIIFGRTDENATPIKLMVDNSAWTNWNAYSGHLAKVAMVEDVTDINTYTTVYEHRWPCSHNYAVPEWQAVGDSLLLYFMPAYGMGGTSNYKTRALFAFGDINSVRPGDQYHCLLISYSQTSNTNYWNNTATSIYNDALLFSNANYKTMARSHHQLPGAVSALWRGLSGAFGEGMSFPNPADNGFYVSTEPVPVHDNLSYRGSLPGVVVPYASPIAFDKTHLNNLPGLPDKLIRLLLCNNQTAAGSGTDYRRLIGFDIKGPWR
ncbi:hypothetical protein [Pseudaeromonas paramecii]|uniref:Uncharacterized protein n=1 Tax=Pseudaeromonas paramecii TaxID=2138166 RepID=A0ABP8PXC7_9GAMM